MPSESDKELMKLLTWQKESIIIDPTQKAVRFTKDGIIELYNEKNVYNAAYFDSLFSGGDD